VDNLITSFSNARVKLVVKLRDRRPREQTNLFIIEGYRELKRAVDARREIDTLFVCPDLFLGSNEHALIAEIRRAKGQILPCSQKVFRKMSYRDRPDGLIAIAPQKHLFLQDIKKPEGPAIYVIAEAIEKPGNLGTMLRSADACAADAMIVCDHCTDIYNPNVVRASIGTLFTVPVVQAGGEEALFWLQKQKISILAATPKAQTLYTDVDMTRPIAIAVGTEQLGLSKKWMEHANIQVRIPMLGIADSLNVSAATTLLLYEALRQRRC